MALGDRITVYPPGYSQGMNKKMPDPRTFEARLRFMLECRKIGHKEFADMAGTSREYIKRCVDGHETPSPKKINKMARLLEVTPEWMKGNPDAPQKFNDRLRQLLTERNMSAAKFAHMAHLSRENAILYATGGLMPPHEKIIKMAEVLEVAPEQLAGNQ